MTRVIRAAIAGGGLVGLTAAASLRRSGHQVTVLEQAPEIRVAGAGIGLWPNALREFDRFGIGAEVRAMGREVDAWFFDPTGRALRSADYDDLAYRYLLVPRAELNAALADAVGRDRITLGARLIGYTETDDEIVVHLGNGDDVRADLLVGADGVHSRVRAQLLPGTEARPHAGNIAWRAIVPAGDERPEGTVLTIGRKRTRGGYSRITAHETMWFVNQFEAGTRTGSKRDRALERARNLAESGWHEELLRMIAATPEADILENQIMVVPALPRWTSHRVALIGDAAHGISPHIAAGGTLGIEDVGVLRDALDTAPTLRAALGAYEQLRIPRFERVREWADEVENADGPAESAQRYAAFSHWMHTTAPRP
ncbi:FAD-dependent oxidoreductase [Nocardia arthritidis]|uniref:NAD(P)-binding protein n=1 Tax=Nocardia arthritidis TaxID=228602 RepID=A0A6G9YKT2_9NOCA|nr:FAD-dependent monooxygenase [Nocardia arthritidis]QIS13814.1 NAD(P)-binding protein [Nocardia arthritidis]